MTADLALIAVVLIIAFTFIHNFVGMLKSVAAVFAFVLAWFAAGVVDIYFFDLNFPLAASRWRAHGEAASLWAALVAVLLQAGFPAAIIFATRRISALREPSQR